MPQLEAFGGAPVERRANSYGPMTMLGWCMHTVGQVPHAFQRRAGAERAGFKAVLARAAALAMSLICRFAPGAIESAAAAFAAGGGNDYLLLSGLLGVLFTSVAMTRFSFACDAHVVRAQLDKRSR